MEEVTEASTYTYEYGFNHCQTKVVELFSDFDLSKIVLQEEATEEAAEEVPIEGVALGIEGILPTEEPHPSTPAPKEEA